MSNEMFAYVLILFRQFLYFLQHLLLVVLKFDPLSVNVSHCFVDNPLVLPRLFLGSELRLRVTHL